MKNRRIVMIMIAVSITLVLAVAAQARHFGHGGKGPGFGPGVWGGMRTFLQLNLTDAQQTKMTGILNKYESERESLREAMNGAHKTMGLLRDAEQFNEQDVRQAFRKASSAREDMFVLRAKMMDELKGVLTSDQVEMLKQGRGGRCGIPRQRAGDCPFADAGK